MDFSSSSLTRLEAALSAGDLSFQERKMLAVGHTGSSKVVLCTGLEAVWKPTGREPKLTARERATYLIDKALGHPFQVLPTVLREVDGQHGALLPYLAEARVAYQDPRSTTLLRYPSSPGYRRMALLDLLIGNRDRHTGNWMFLEDSTIVPIDHGLAFPPYNGSQWYRAYDFWCETELGDEEEQIVTTLLQKRGELERELGPLLEPDVISAMFGRAEKCLDLGRTYRWLEGGQSAELKLFLERTGLDESRPEHSIRLTVPLDYDEMLDHVEVHRYYLGLEWGHQPSVPEAAASWYDQVYLPIINAVHESGLMHQFPRRTAADLYRWVTHHREEMALDLGHQPSDMEVARELAQQYSERPLVGLWRTALRAIKAVHREFVRGGEPPRRAP